MNIHESAEDYLEMILMLAESKGAVRSVDIANNLNVTKASVSVAMKHLRENGYIVMDKSSLISLTDKGMAIADAIYSRHRAISAFLIKIGVGEENAKADACKIEHDISAETYEAILKQLQQA